MYSLLLTTVGLLAAAAHTAAGMGILFPQSSETREVKSLDGLWEFAVLPSLNNSDIRWMPVPASYNDIATEKSIRDHVGIVRYQRTFFVATTWQDQMVWVRFGSVNYGAKVHINDKFAVQHSIGHLPFAADVSALLNYGKLNTITVHCDNRLWPITIPQGNVSIFDTDDGKKAKQTYTFDFFNYAGIHRSVFLYTTPKSYIDDVTVIGEIYNKTFALIVFKIIALNNPESHLLGVKLYDAYGNFIVSSSDASGSLKVHNPKLWWPHLMAPDDKTRAGYLYMLQCEMQDVDGMLVDIYRVRVGIRSLTWSNDTFLLNGKPLYMTGFGRHEDRNIGGRGFDLPTVIRDHELIKWMGANAYRTSHYPYAEEMLDITDELGILVIAECPAVNIDNVSQELLDNHKRSIQELIRRDKNRPSVIAWSVANEPRSQKPNTRSYFKQLATYTKLLDATRPITASLNRAYSEDNLAPFLDVISFNRYNSWYENEGQLDMIVKNVINEATNWRKTFNRTVLMSEYGADTMEGLHLSPAYIWSEEYQVEVLTKHFKAFDQLRSQGWFIGEFVWNFADFKTAQKTTRVGGNKKGIFTRQREPKAAAHLLRKRYHYIAHQAYNASMPGDLEEYVIRRRYPDEL